MLYLHSVSFSSKLSDKNTLYSTDHYISDLDKIDFFSEYDHTEVTKITVKPISLIDSETLTSFGTAFQLPKSITSIEVNGYDD